MTWTGYLPFTFKIKGIDVLDFDFRKEVSSYIDENHINKEKNFHYEEPRTNISRFKKNEKEYAEKLLNIADRVAEGDQRSKELEYFLQYKISGDLRAIDTLYEGNKFLTDGYGIWINQIENGRLFFPLSSTFAIVLMHQIVNRTVIENPNWAIIIMTAIWNYYYPDFQHKEVLMWIRDYWLVYENQISYDELKGLFKYEITFQGDEIEPAINQVNLTYIKEKKILDFFNDNCDYRIKKGRTVEEGYGELLEEILARTLSKLEVLFVGKNKTLETYFNITEIEMFERKRDIFRRAILSDKCKESIFNLNRNIFIGENEKCTIINEDGLAKIIFSRKRYTYDKSRLFIENIGKITELYLRNWLGIPAKFIVSIDDISKLFSLEDDIGNDFSESMVKIIENTVEEVCQNNCIEKSSACKGSIEHLVSNKRVDIPDRLNNEVFSIDINRLDKIRDDAEIIKERLVVNEPEEDLSSYEISISEEIKDVKEEPQTSVVNEWELLWSELSTNEKHLVNILLEQNEIDLSSRLVNLSKSSGILLEVLVEGINEKAIEVIGDNLLDFNLENPQIYADYVTEIVRVS